MCSLLGLTQRRSPGLCPGGLSLACLLCAHLVLFLLLLLPDVPGLVLSLTPSLLRLLPQMFQARLAKQPEQCLRYCFQEGARPLWPRPDQQPLASQVHEP